MMTTEYDDFSQEELLTMIHEKMMGGGALYDLLDNTVRKSSPEDFEQDYPDLVVLHTALMAIPNVLAKGAETP